MSIQVRNLSHIYNKGLATEHVALDNINFDIYDGEIVGIIGHTGSGKSTLLQHLNGLLKAERGNIEGFYKKRRRSSDAESRMICHRFGKENAAFKIVRIEFFSRFAYACHYATVY